MSQPAPHARPVAEVAEDPHFSRETQYAPQMYRSLPIPARTSRGVDLAFLLGNETANPRVGLSYGVPARLAFVDLSSGAERETHAVTAADFGQPAPPDGSLGVLRPLTVEQAIDLPRMQRLLYAAYDRLIPAFAARRTALSAPEREAARTAREALAQLQEPQLKPYYAVVGREFFAWLGSVR